MKTTVKFFQSIYPIFLLIVIFSCEEVIDLELDRTQPRLVIEGRVEKSKTGTIPQQEIRLTTTSDFFVNETAPTANGAIVWVETDNGSRFDYTEVEAGRYVNTELQGEIGMKYILNVEWEGALYTASEQLISVAAIDSLYQVEEKENLFEDGGIKLAINFSDPEDQLNYYFWETIIDGELVVLPDPGNKNNIIANDDFFDGQQVEGYFPNEELVLEPVTNASVRQVALNINAYKYYFSLFDQAAKTGSILDTPPAPVRGNVTNLTEPDNYPLGYFYAAEVDEKSISIEVVE